MRYFQSIIYADILCERCIQINQFIKNVRKTEEKKAKTVFVNPM